MRQRLGCEADDNAARVWRVLPMPASGLLWQPHRRIAEAAQEIPVRRQLR
jgi:hypothetical protein